VRYRFGDFVLSPARRVLTGGGRVVPLIPKYFDLLVLLIEQRDRALGKQEIFDRVWPDVVVSESALTQAIRGIRRALGDDPREPRFVRTVSRHGYQFVFGPVELEDDSAPGQPQPEPSRVAALPPRGTLLRDGMLAALGAALAGTIGGLAGGLALRLVPGSDTGAQLAFTLALVGALAGALAGGGVGTGLVAADALSRPARAARLALGGGLAGLLTGWLAHHAARAVLTGLFGRDVPDMGGPIEGLVLGATTGLGYALGTGRLLRDATAFPGRARWQVAAVTGFATAIGGVALAAAGRHLVGSSLDLMAGAFSGSQVGLEPLARLLGEERLRPMTRMVISGFEGALFGSGVALGLTAPARPPVDPP
jgi:DNA-binding winged helix-turn-helix (wHTH) protein